MASKAFVRSRKQSRSTLLLCARYALVVLYQTKPVVPHLEARPLPQPRVSAVSLSKHVVLQCGGGEV